MASRDCDRDRGADALQQVFSLTLQINGVICRLQAGKLQINQAAEKCMTLTDQIDKAAENVSKNIKQDNKVLRAELNIVREKNIKLLQTKAKLENELKEANNRILELEQDDIDMVSFCRFQEEQFDETQKSRQPTPSTSGKSLKETQPNTSQSAESVPNNSQCDLSQTSNSMDTSSNKSQPAQSNPINSQSGLSSKSQESRAPTSSTCETLPTKMDTTPKKSDVKQSGPITDEVQPSNAESIPETQQECSTQSDLFATWFVNWDSWVAIFLDLR